MTPRPRRGGGPTPTPAAPSRSWRDRLDDVDEPLYTIAVASELLATSQQTIRRLEDALEVRGQRPSGNQRRYSRRELEYLSSACELSARGFSPLSVARIIAMESEGRSSE